MSSIEPEDFGCLLLEPFQLCNQKMAVLEYAGGGRAGYVFKVLIGDNTYALKMFKFDNPKLHPSRLKGVHRRAVYDNFLVECRANGSLIDQHNNGKFTPFCYGWITVPTWVEIYVARKFNIQPFLWDRPPDASNKSVRAILFEWVDGKMLSQVQINQEIANQIRAGLKGLHQASIAHRDIRAANILVTDSRVYLINLNASLTLPHIKISTEKLKEIQKNELRDLEIGFALLSEVPINQRLCVADMSLLGPSSLDEILTTYDSIKHHWWPPKPTCWHGRSWTPTDSGVERGSAGGFPSSTVARNTADQDGKE